jgi:short-subunit dehydrogenase involved in D-alanine esterification of teichoic acids
VYIVAYFEGVIQDSETINVMVNNAGILDEKHWSRDKFGELYSINI